MEYVSIYLDESGDLGFDFNNRGTPKHFIITLLYCENTAAAKMITTCVKRTLRRKLQTKKTAVNRVKRIKYEIGNKGVFLSTY